MKLVHNPSKVAGTLFMFSAAPVILAWAILLFIGHDTTTDAIGQLQYIFSQQNETRWWFVWFAALPVLSIMLGFAYLNGFADTKQKAILLLALSVSLGGAAFVCCDWSIAVFVSLPIVWGVSCVRRI